MSGASPIQWTDATWNPVRGCSRVSEGCRNCYAERVTARFSGPGKPFEGFAHRVGGEARWTGKVELVPKALDWPLRRRKPLRIFVNSMSDLFHESLSGEAIAAVFGVMACAPQHTFQVLTKRPERMQQWCLGMTEAHAADLGARFIMSASLHAAPVNYPHTLNVPALWPLPNVWLGVSVEDQTTADERIPLLLATPAGKRFVSYEPALGPVDFRLAWLSPFVDYTPAMDRTARLDWIIVGGESGPGARPFDVAWARRTIYHGIADGVPVFVKQLGAFPVTEREVGTAKGGSHVPLHLRDSHGGDPGEWPEDLRWREFPS